MSETPLFPATMSVEDRLLHLETQQLSLAASMLRSFTTIHESHTDSETHLRWCIAHVHALHAVVWMLSVLNVVLLAILCWREIYR